MVAHWAGVRGGHICRRAGYHVLMWCRSEESPTAMANRIRRLIVRRTKFLTGVGRGLRTDLRQLFHQAWR